MLKSPATFFAVAVSCSWGFACPDVSAEVDFERDVRPIFAEKCLLCHGPDDRKGGLRLTGIEFATAELESGDRGIVPGQPEDSAVVARIHSSDPEEVMPPPKKAEALTEEEKNTLTQWI
ncbi:MAG: hypothetical protein KDM63_15050, partial [Verrucomicrobiae bacterium]|nr:hypothetical protein [Verrucomicrobiae bacterium]